MHTCFLWCEYLGVEECTIYRYLYKFLRNSQLFSKGVTSFYVPLLPSVVSKVQLPHLLALDTVNLFKILAVLIAGWWYCVLKSVSLVIDYSENLFLCLLVFFVFFWSSVCSDLLSILQMGCLSFYWEVLVYCRFKMADTIGKHAFSVSGFSVPKCSLEEHKLQFRLSPFYLALFFLLWLRLYMLHLWNFSLNQSQNNFF